MAAVVWSWVEKMLQAPPLRLSSDSIKNQEQPDELKRFRLLSLPAEMRVTIYEFLPATDLLSLNRCYQILHHEVQEQISKSAVLRVRNRNNHGRPDCYGHALRIMSQIPRLDWQRVRSVIAYAPSASPLSMHYEACLEAYEKASKILFDNIKDLKSLTFVLERPIDFGRRLGTEHFWRTYRNVIAYLKEDLDDSGNRLLWSKFPLLNDYLIGSAFNPKHTKPKCDELVLCLWETDYPVFELGLDIVIHVLAHNVRKGLPKCKLEIKFPASMPTLSSEQLKTIPWVEKVMTLERTCEIRVEKYHVRVGHLPL